MTYCLEDKYSDLFFLRLIWPGNGFKRNINFLSSTQECYSRKDFVTPTMVFYHRMQRIPSNGAPLFRSVMHTRVGSKSNFGLSCQEIAYHCFANLNLGKVMSSLTSSKVTSTSIPMDNVSGSQSTILLAILKPSSSSTIA